MARALLHSIECHFENGFRTHHHHGPESVRRCGTQHLGQLFHLGISKPAVSLSDVHESLRRTHRERVIREYRCPPAAPLFGGCDHYVQGSIRSLELLPGASALAGLINTAAAFQKQTLVAALARLRKQAVDSFVIARFQLRRNKYGRRLTTQCVRENLAALFDRGLQGATGRCAASMS